MLKIGRAPARRLAPYLAQAIIEGASMSFRYLRRSNMSVLVLIGRVLFVGVFLSAVIPHLTKTTMMAGYAKSKCVPLAWPATFVGGILLLAGGLSVLLGIWADLGALLLAVFLLPTAVLMHGFWRETGEGRMSEQVHFFKDVGLA